jgi:hypothetical protein
MRKQAETKAMPPGTFVKVQTLPACDFECQGVIPHKANYDGATRLGPWAYMCDDAFRKYGVGVGTGRGQRLIPPAK